MILMSQNRQAARDRLAAGLDYEINLKAEVEIMALHDKLDRIRMEGLEGMLAAQSTRIEAIAVAVGICPAKVRSGLTGRILMGRRSASSSRPNRPTIPSGRRCDVTSPLSARTRGDAVIVEDLAFERLALAVLKSQEDVVTGGVVRRDQPDPVGHRLERDQDLGLGVLS